MDTILLAGILDRLSIVLYGLSSKKAKKPELITDKLIETKEIKKGSIFKSGKDYEKRKKELLKAIGGGNGK